MTAKVLKTKWGLARIDNTTGYYHITTSKEGYHLKYLHRLIYEAYYGEIPEGYHVHHIDGNKLNNRFDNLELLPKGKHTSLHMSGENNSFYKKKHTKESKKKISESKIGKPRSEETKQKISKKQSGENNSQAKYNLWDIKYTLYYKGKMLRNNCVNKPKRVFQAKYKGYKLPIGLFIDFITPKIIGELIEEYI